MKLLLRFLQHRPGPDQLVIVTHLFQSVEPVSQLFHPENRHGTFQFVGQLLDLRGFAGGNRLMQVFQDHRGVAAKQFGHLAQQIIIAVQLGQYLFPIKQQPSRLNPRRGVVIRDRAAARALLSL